MNRNFSDRHDGSFQTHRSERYRHPEQDRYRFDDDRRTARGGYGNEGNTGTWGNRGNEMGGSRNYGNMGSYGGAQGFGTSRGGYASQHPDESRSGYNYYSGMGSAGQGTRDRGGSSGGGYRSEDRWGSDRNRPASSGSSRDLYGSDTFRRFGGPGQGRYDFKRDDYNAGSNSYRGSSGRGGYNSPNYGGSEGNYMGSGYSRSSQQEYNSGNRGDYDSSGLYEGSGYSYDQPYGMSGYYSGGYGDRTQGWGSSRPGSNYFESENRGRTFNRDRGDSRERGYGDRY
ncbi:hypothetical protein GCM10023188_32530 [Pontibacter saemangeumensis]|uniref:Uncharacterized protein n=1 Tax=Pontibacter saemangeumensis TaxID=1084525 RepID=A0ABP8LW42_9BACT